MKKMKNNLETALYQNLRIKKKFKAALQYLMVNLANIKIIIENSSIPVIIDAGIGAPSQAALALELGADGVLLNTAVAQSKLPNQMAIAMKLAVKAGRLGYLAGQMPKKYYADPSSPLDQMSKL
jgi:thiazole synthase